MTPVGGWRGGSATWTATDVGGSGVNGPASGSVRLATSSIGTHTAAVAAGTEQDTVGHPPEAAMCYYTVIYFDGFFRPVDMDGVWNTAKGRERRSPSSSA